MEAWNFFQFIKYYTFRQNVICPEQNETKQSILLEDSFLIKIGKAKQKMKKEQGYLGLIWMDLSFQIKLKYLYPSEHTLDSCSWFWRQRTQVATMESPVVTEKTYKLQESGLHFKIVLLLWSESKTAPFVSLIQNKFDCPLLLMKSVH